MATTDRLATVQNDIIYPIYQGALSPRDPTLLERGGLGFRAYDVYLNLLKDCHLFAVLQKRYAAVCGREWEVVPASGSRIDRKAADLCREQLKNLGSKPNIDTKQGESEVFLDGSFDQACYGILSAIFFGYSTTEIIWERQGGEYIASSLESKDLRRFVFLPGKSGFLMRMLTPESSFEGIPVPPRKLIWHRFAAGSIEEDPYGLGIASRLFYPSFFKRNAAKFWLVFADKFGSPTAVLKYPKGTSKEEKDALKAMLKSISTDAGVSIPDYVSLEFIEAARASTVSTYKELIDFCNEEISKATIGETGTTDQSTGGGSKARDEVADRVRVEIAKSDADLLSETLNRTLLSWITWLNFGDKAKPPKVWRKFPELDAKENLDSRAGRDKTLLSMGYRLTREKATEIYGEGYESADQSPPLYASLGESGTTLLMQFVQQIAQGGLPKENAEAVLTSVFGLTLEQAAAIVPEDTEDGENPPDLGALGVGGDEVVGEPNPEGAGEEDILGRLGLTGEEGEEETLVEEGEEVDVEEIG